VQFIEPSSGTYSQYTEIISLNSIINRLFFVFPARYELNPYMVPLYSRFVLVIGFIEHLLIV
jgi:hypothetical protein